MHNVRLYVGLRATLRDSPVETSGRINGTGDPCLNIGLSPGNRARLREDLSQSF